MRRLFFGNSGGSGTNPIMTLTAVLLGGSEQIGFLIFGGRPQPNGVFINGKKYNITQLLTNFQLNGGTAFSVLSFEGSVLPCNSVQLEINGTAHTFTNNGKAYSNNDNIFEENETYTIKLLSTT